MIYCIICVMGPVKYFSLGPSKSLSGPGPLVRVTVRLEFEVMVRIIRDK